MKAIRFHEFGSPSVLRFEEVRDPVLRDGSVLVRVAATSVNQIDLKIRAGAVKERMPVDLPFIPGVDLVGTVLAVGEGVASFRPGDRVMGIAEHTYAELCVVQANHLAPVPEGLISSAAAILPLVNLTGDQLVRDGAKAQKGQTILVTGALGAVGRSAVFAATNLECRIIAGVLKSQISEASSLTGVCEAVALDDDSAIDALRRIDCVADTVGGNTAVKVIKRIRDGGIFGTSVVGDYQRHGIEVNAVSAHADAPTTLHFAQAARDGKFTIPRGNILALASAVQGQTLAESGAVGKIVLEP